MDILGDPDPRRARRVLEAMLKSRKLEIPELKRAHGWNRAFLLSLGGLL
jgi:hypothetical protein